jgi:hypothetical protein
MLAGYGQASNIGDLVALVTGGGDATTSGEANEGGIYPTVELAAAGARIFGAIVAIEPDRSDLTKVGRTASTRRQVMVAKAADGLIFEATADAAMNLNTIGNTYDHNATTSTTGVSAMDIDVATAGTGSGGLQLVGIRNDPANVGTISSSAGTTSTVWEVVIAEPQVFPTQVGAGV